MIEFIQSEPVDFPSLESIVGDLQTDNPIGAHLGNFGSAIEPGTRQSLYLQGQELVHRAQALD